MYKVTRFKRVSSVGNMPRKSKHRVCIRKTRNRKKMVIKQTGRPSVTFKRSKVIIKKATRCKRIDKNTSYTEHLKTLHHFKFDHLTR